MFKDMLSQIQSIYSRYPSSEIEVETRFFHWSGDRHLSGVSRDTFTRIREAFSGYTEYLTTIRSHDESMTVAKGSSIRKQTVEGQEPLWSQKTILARKEYETYDFSLVISQEKRVKIPASFNPTMTRTRRRWSYDLGYARLELTEALVEVEKQTQDRTNPTKTTKYTQYEVELEFVKQGTHITSTHLSQFESAFLTILRLVQGTTEIYTAREKEDIIEFINKQIAQGAGLMRYNPSKYAIDFDMLVKTRNLKFGDLISGGIIHNGRDGAYRITHKTDGIRQLLVFSPVGVWLAMAPDQVHLVMRSRLESFLGVVLDGELVTKDKRKRGVTMDGIDSPLWYFIFDCLSYPDYGQVQKRRHTERMRLAQNVADVLKSDVIRIYGKEFRAFENPEEFFVLMRTMFAEQDSLSYHQMDSYLSPMVQCTIPDLMSIPSRTDSSIECQTFASGSRERR